MFFKKFGQKRSLYVGIRKFKKMLSMECGMTRKFFSRLSPFSLLKVPLEAGASPAPPLLMLPTPLWTIPTICSAIFFFRPSCVKADYLNPTGQPKIQSKLHNILVFINLEIFLRKS